jgi:hypothetical protein
MRTKALLTSILLGTMSLAGVASANPVIRDHRYTPAVTVQPAVKVRYDHRAPKQPTTYGYQVAANGQYVLPYTYGNDPYVEGIARGEWSTLASCLDMQNHAVELDLKGRPLRTIELQATGGSANLIDAGIIFSDGTQMPIRLDRALDPTHAPNVRIDLGTHGLDGVRRIVIEGRGYASFRVLGA